jgi:hypothetical protein
MYKSPLFTVFCVILLLCFSCKSQDPDPVPNPVYEACCGADPIEYKDGRHQPVYRKGTFITRMASGPGTGIAIGRNLVTHQLNENRSYKSVGDPEKFNHFLLPHETGHYQQQKNMGFGSFYARTSYEYLVDPGFNNVYNTSGTLEFGADTYAKSILGYGY